MKRDKLYAMRVSASRLSEVGCRGCFGMWKSRRQVGGSARNGSSSPGNSELLAMSVKKAGERALKRLFLAISVCIEATSVLSIAFLVLFFCGLSNTVMAGACRHRTPLYRVCRQSLQVSNSLPDMIKMVVRSSNMAHF